jgi:hypothetical protein
VRVRHDRPHPHWTIDQGTRGHAAEVVMAIGGLALGAWAKTWRDLGQ